MPYITKILKNGIEFSFDTDELHKMGVYKITIDDNKFYIGSTSGFKKRIMIYRTNFNRCKHESSKSFAEAAIGCKKVRFDVLQSFYLEEVSLLKVRAVETKFIKKYFNENCINRSKNGISNKGIHWTKEECLKISKGLKLVKPKKEKAYCPPNPKGIKIDAFDSVNNTAISYKNLSEAITKTGISGYLIRKNLYGYTQKCGKFIFSQEKSFFKLKANKKYFNKGYYGQHRGGTYCEVHNLITGEKTSFKSKKDITVKLGISDYRIDQLVKGLKSSYKSYTIKLIS